MAAAVARRKSPFASSGSMARRRNPAAILDLKETGDSSVSMAAAGSGAVETRVLSCVWSVEWSKEGWKRRGIVSMFFSTVIGVKREEKKGIFFFESHHVFIHPKSRLQRIHTATARRVERENT
jgi:hypothetical protein